jgi:hypothetical protein
MVLGMGVGIATTPTELNTATNVKVFVQEHAKDLAQF